MKILRVSASKAKSGGNFYEKLLDEVFLTFDYEVFYPIEKSFSRFKYLYVFHFYFKIFFKSLTTQADVVIQPLESMFWLNSKKRNIVIVHHYDSSHSNVFSKINQRLTFWFLRFNLKKIEKIIVVSRFWKEYLNDIGFDNVEVIYNPYDIDEYVANFSYESKMVDNVLSQTLTNIYIGNAHPKKGALIVAKALLGLPVNLITTGAAALNVDNVKNIYLSSDEDYKYLLRKVDLVIANSQFKEGWCRVAHEAMLLKTKVIGSGKGGMKELLENSNQCVASEPAEIRHQVERFVLDRSAIPEINYEYVQSFSVNVFTRSWLELIGD